MAENMESQGSARLARILKVRSQEGFQMRASKMIKEPKSLSHKCALPYTSPIFLTKAW